MSRPFSVVVLGLSLSSSWGNGHATTWRALARGLAQLKCDVLFLERETPWYAAHRDLIDPDFCDLAFYDSLEDLDSRYGAAVAAADVAVIGSYVPEGVAAARLVLKRRPRRITAFYDIDTPVTLAKLARGESDYLTPELIPAFDMYFSFTGGPILDRLVREFGAKRANALYCAVDEDLYYPSGESPDVDLGFLGTYSPDRQPALERLLIEPARRLPDKAFIVAGPQFPSDIDWPSNVERIEHLSPAEHRAFYGRLRFALNVTRADMVAAGWSPSVRLFEAAACGTPVISDAWRGLTDLFPENEAVIVARDADDVVAALSGMSEERRRALGEAARIRALEKHTGCARAKEMLDALIFVLNT